MSSTATAPDIDSPYALTDAHIAQFDRDGFIKLKDVFTREQLEYYREETMNQVKERSANTKPLEERSLYGKAFLQVSNIWEHSELVREFVFGKRLARIATELLGTRGVRVYHDQALYKEAGGGYTPWHVDQVYWPLETDRTVTAWVPFHPVPLENGPLCFATGSQHLHEGRDLVISEESERLIGERMKLSDFPVNETPYDLGEVSFHLGFCFHRAGPNQLEQPREVMTVIYMDSEMRLAEPKSEPQRKDWGRWCPGAQVGEVIDTHLNPVLFEREAEEGESAS